MFSRRRSYLRAALLASSAPVLSAQFIPGDPYRENVILDVRQTGSDASVNNNFIDSSATGHTITANGNATQGAFTPHQPNGWSNYFDGVDDQLTVTDHADFNIPIAGADCTVQFFCKPKDFNTVATPLGHGGSAWAWNGTTGVHYYFYIGTDGQIDCSWNIGASAQHLTGTTSLNLNEWNHVAVCWNGTNFSMFVNGSREATTTTEPGTLTTPSVMRIGNTHSIAQWFTGEISDVCINKTTDLFGAGNTSCTVPTKALTAASGTVLLTCQSNRFADNSGANHAISLSSAPYVIAGSPYGQTVAYDPATHGGSCYFDGAAAFLSTPNHADFQFGTGDLTIECWINTTDTTFCIAEIDGGTTGYWRLVVLSGTVYWQSARDTTNVFSTACTFNDGAFHHIVITRSGTTNTLWVDGVDTANATNSVDWNGSSGSLNIGDSVTAAYDFLGFMAEFRIVKGTAVYTTAFTPPTAPLTAVTNTKFLALMQDAAIYDASCNSNIKVGGNTATDTGVTDIAPSSVLFDGTTGPLTCIAPTKAIQTLGTKDFTLEFRVYPTNNDFEIYIDWRASALTNLSLTCFQRSGVLTMWTNGTDRIIGTNLTDDTWNDVAICRHEGTTRMFLNGVQDGSDYADSNNYIVASAEGVTFGGFSGSELTGNMEMIRFTYGVARYLGTYTPNAAEHPELHGYSADAEAETDAYFNKVQLLLKTLSSDALDNNAFTDGSDTGHTITANGDVTQGSFSPFQPHGWSNSFRNKADPLTFTDHTDFQLGAIFTIELWAKPAVAASTGLNSHGPLARWGASGSRSYGIRQTSTFWGFEYSIDGTADGNIDSTSPVVLDEWVHIAVTGDGTDFRLYLNGVHEATVASASGPHAGSSINLIIGDGSSNCQAFDGELSDVRIVNGTAVYTGTSSFTPPTEPLTAIANTVLLTCQANRFIDNGPTGHAPAVANSPEIWAGDPYLSATAYSQTVHGSSAYFDGVTDYLTVPDHAEWNWATAMTISVWVYPTVLNNYNNIIERYGAPNSEFILRTRSTGNVEFIYSFDGSADLSLISSSDKVTLNTWNHIALVWSGSDYSLFVNGGRGATATSSNAPFAGTNVVRIGIFDGLTLYPFTGYMSDLILNNGEALWSASSSTITVPTTIHSLDLAEDNELRLDFGAAGIYDTACKNTLILNGDTQTDTAVFKFGSSSVLFDGTGDDITIPHNDGLLIGTGDYCVEGWVYLNSLASYGHLFDMRSADSGQWAPQIRMSSAGTMPELRLNSTIRLQGPVQAVDTWFYLTVNRVDGVHRMFVNGLVVDEWADGTALVNNGDYTMGKAAAGTVYRLDGQVEDWRITIGEGRYTANFAIPTTDLPAKGA